jgi:hypothetical protein
MRRRPDAAWLVILGVLFAAAAPVFAHHSFTAEFDPTKEFTVTGVLSKVDWINPHAAVWVDVKDAKSGKSETWGCEGNPPSTYSRVGVHRDAFKVGENIAMTCLVAKDGSKRWGYLRMIKYMSDGHVLVFRMGQE